MISENSNKSQLEQYTELAKNSLVKVQYSCSGNSTGIDNSDYIHIVDETKSNIGSIDYSIATENEKSAIIELPSTNNLPVSDLDTRERTFIVAIVKDKVIGCVGVETYDYSGLLRSLAVNNDFRGQGIGKRLVVEAETWAKKNKLKNLYLLTTTASGFFPKINWTHIDRTAVPESIKSSTEFVSICPSTAVCMIKELE